MSGNLIIKPLSGKLTRDTETFGKMDPYVKVIMGSQKEKGPVAKDAGKFPGWNCVMNMRRSAEEIISFEVWDKDSASSDDLVGNGILAFSKILQSKNHFNSWIPLTYKGKNAGELLVDIEFFPDGGNQQ